MKYKLVSSKFCKDLLKEYPDYKVFRQCGYSFKGAAEYEDDKQPKKEFVYQEGKSRVLTFEERMDRFFKWATAINVTVDKKEIHFNGFSENDLYW